MSSMPNPDVLIPARDLTALAAQLLDAVGVASVKSKLVAESLVAANLRGVDSHGVQLLPYYLDQLEFGDMDLHANGRVISESGACLLYDGQNGIGQPIAETCCAHAVRIARATGVALVVARDSNHVGGGSDRYRDVQRVGAGAAVAG
jgi:LDH2 family malate/lactate/ureidoglycolate dehydrogenase